MYGLDTRLYKQTVDPHAFGQLRLLVASLLPVVNNAIRKEYDHVRGDPEALSPDEVAALPDAEWTPPGIADLKIERTGQRHAPEGGWFSYSWAVTVPEEDVPVGQTFNSVPDAPMRRRQSVIVTGSDKDAVFRKVGDRAEDEEGET